MFWGLIMEPKRRYFQKVTRPFHISMASMDLFACTKEPVQLMVHFQSRNYLLCTLQKSGPLQVRLDLNFEAGDEVSFTINGQSHVHLSGYHLEDDYVDVDSDDDGEEEEEEVENDRKQVAENVEEEEAGDVSLSNIVYGKRKQTKSDATSSLTPNAKRSKTLDLFADVAEGSDDDEDDENVTFSDLEDDDDDDDDEGETTMDSNDDEDLVDSDDTDDDGDEEGDDSSFLDLELDDGDEEQEAGGEDSDNDEEVEEQLVEKKLTKKKKKKQKQLANNQSPQKTPEPPKKQQKQKQNNKKADQQPAKQEQQQTQVNGTPTSEKKKKKKNKKQQQNESLNTTDKDVKPKEPKTPKSEKKQQNQQTPSPKAFVDRGVSIEELVIGGGNPAKNGKVAHVYYEGRLKQNKKMFDNCLKGPPFKFRLGASEVIKGWDVGVAGMKIGGKRRITIPPQLAYGAKGVKPDIPSNAALVFDIELKNVT